MQLAAYLGKRILKLWLRILLQLFHFHKHAVRLRVSLAIIILQDVTDAWIHYLREDGIAWCCESQSKQGDSQHPAPAGPAAAALWGGGCGSDAEIHKQRHHSWFLSVTARSSPHAWSKTAPKAHLKLTLDDFEHGFYLFPFLHKSRVNGFRCFV